MTILSFLKSYETEGHDVMLSPIVSAFGNRVIFVEVSFNKKDYNRGNFARIIDYVYEESGHAAWVSEEDWRQFYRGSFTIKINNASHNYDEERISKMLKTLANGIFSELHK